MITFTKLDKQKFLDRFSKYGYVSYEDVVEEHGREFAYKMLGYGKHCCGDSGELCWHAPEYHDIVGLIKIEENNNNLHKKIKIIDRFCAIHS